MSTKPSDADRFDLHYFQGMLRAAFRSLFWCIISERKKAGMFSLADLVSLLPRGDKGKVSKWFNGDPNWTINTIGTLANALNVEIEIRATDRATGVVYTPSGIVHQHSLSPYSETAGIRVASRKFSTNQIFMPEDYPTLLSGDFVEVERQVSYVQAVG